MIRAPLMVLVAASLLSLLGGTAHRKTEQGNEHLAEGQLDEALAAYTEAQVHAPDSPFLYYDVGNVLYRQGDYEGAAEAYERVLLEGPPDVAPLAAFNLGNARFKQEKFQDAVSAYRRTLEAAPGDADAKRNLELALRELQEQQQEQQKQDQQEQQKENDQQNQGQGQEPEKPPEQQEGGGQPNDRRNPSERAQESMTPEQARRMLDSLAEQERRQLEQQARGKGASKGTPREKDW
jgi:tetratricopeptide (TPR) repeat protein